jgi:nicotinamidase-related amidase
MTSIYESPRTALLVVDPYNDFMSEGGKLYAATKETADSVGFYAHMRQLLPAVRAAGMPVFIVPHHRAKATDFAGWHAVNGLQEQGREMQAFAVDSWGGEWHPEFGPQDGDVIVGEHWAQNGFANTDLEAQLNQHGIENIVLVGFIANSCVEATGRYGMELGYHVTLVKDATAAFNPEGMVAAAINGPMYAHAIMTTEELLAALPQPSADRAV